MAWRSDHNSQYAPRDKMVWGERRAGGTIVAATKTDEVPHAAAE
jgi:hypothetical protein